MPREGHDFGVALVTDSEGADDHSDGSGQRGDFHNIHIYNHSAVIDDDTKLSIYIIEPEFQLYRNLPDGDYGQWTAPAGETLMLELTGAEKLPAIGERKKYNPWRRAQGIGGDDIGVVRDEYILRSGVRVTLEGVVGVVPPLPDPPDPLPVDYTPPEPSPADKSGQMMFLQFEIHGERDPNS